MPRQNVAQNHFVPNTQNHFVPNTQIPLVVRLFLMNGRFRILGAERVPVWGPGNTEVRRRDTLCRRLLIAPQSCVSPTECIFGFHLFLGGLWSMNWRLARSLKIQSVFISLFGAKHSRIWKDFHCVGIFIWPFMSPDLVLHWEFVWSQRTN